jgi:hypothetical protein
MAPGVGTATNFHCIAWYFGLARSSHLPYRLLFLSPQPKFSDQGREESIDIVGIGAVMYEMVMAHHLLGEIWLELIISEAERGTLIGHGEVLANWKFSNTRPGVIRTFPNGRSRSI